ncbi:hypothetical protein PIB30_100516 [Stylosanthes scabra]|uniref:Uncharacterized protein n=1 Tax=Stylosanthes scabra TaxID=79078 RepID=A0ABU6ZVX3_9FABA|nr:hypothetical protein [Stylosanthes scabra]
MVRTLYHSQGQVRRGRTAKESPDQVTQTLAPHAYACYSTAITPLLHSSLTHPRICVAFYAYAYHLIHHPAQPPFYTKATLPTHMRALHAYACYHNTQHHHTLPCLTYIHTKATLPRICVTFYAYAWHTHTHFPSIPTTHYPLITHAYASILTHMRGTLTKSHFPLPHSHLKFTFSTPTHMRPFIRICVGLSPTSHFNPTSSPLFYLLQNHSTVQFSCLRTSTAASLV